MCRAAAQGVAQELPVKAKAKPRKQEERTLFLLFSHQGRVALQKRPEKGLLAGLWEFPNVEGALDEAAAGAAVSVWGLEPRRWESRLTAKHIFTHVEWHMNGVYVELDAPAPALTFVTPAELRDAYALPSAFRSFVSVLED